jgi:hypothetical protein
MVVHNNLMFNKLDCTTMARKKAKKPPKPNVEYTLPKNLMGKPEKLVLAMDPGSRNFGIALVGLENGEPRCYLNSVMMRPVNDLVAFARTKKNFLIEVAGWMKYGPSGVVAERFQTRGGGASMGPLIEQVSAMLGLIAGSYPELPIKLTIASVWKNSMHRRFADEYRDDPELTNEKGEFDLRAAYKQISVEPHQLDASLIGIYGLEQGLDLKLDFDFADWVSQVEASSRIPLRQRRGS